MVRESNFSNVMNSQAAIVITQTQYDKRALTCTDLLPLTNSLFNLSYMTSVSTLRIAYILATDGGLELVVQILKRLKTKSDNLSRFAYSAALTCLSNVAVRGNQRLRKRLVQAGVVPVIIDLLMKVVKVLQVIRSSQQATPQQSTPPINQQQALMQHLQQQILTPINQPPFGLPIPDPTVIVPAMRHLGDQTNGNVAVNIITMAAESVSDVDNASGGEDDTQSRLLDSHSVTDSSVNGVDDDPPNNHLLRRSRSASSLPPRVTSSASVSESSSPSASSNNDLANFDQEQQQPTTAQYPLSAPNSNISSEMDIVASPITTNTFSLQNLRRQRSLPPSRHRTPSPISRSFNVYSSSSSLDAPFTNDQEQTNHQRTRSTSPLSNIFTRNPSTQIPPEPIISDPDTMLTDILYRVDDILLAIKLIAYLSKYPTIRADLHSDPTHNVFELVEVFTTPSNLVEIRKWAQICMRNAFKRDLVHGEGGGSALRRCGYLKCGKIEGTPRQYSKCSRCRRVTYCCKTCQRQAWPLHKNWCLKYESVATTATVAATGQVMEGASQGQSVNNDEDSNNNNYGASMDSMRM